VRARQVWWRSLLAGAVCLTAHGTRADDSITPDIPQASDRPKIGLNRWQEDWSVLADPALRTEPFDNLKYISLSDADPNSYASLGLNLRERVESTQLAPFGIGSSSCSCKTIELPARTSSHLSTRIHSISNRPS
jgi:hypothetical protein